MPTSRYEFKAPFWLDIKGYGQVGGYLVVPMQSLYFFKICIPS